MTQSSCPDYEKQVWSGVQEMYRSGLLFDYTLVSGKFKFPVHKVILAACSDFFKTMFNTDMKEKNEDTFTLETINADCAKLVRDFIYTGTIDLNHENYSTVLNAASFLQIPTLLKVVGCYLESTVDTEHCIDIMRVANYYHLEHASKGIYNFILDNFSALVYTETNKLTFDELNSFVGNDNLKVIDEASLVGVMKNWMQVNKGVDFGNIPQQRKFDEDPWTIFTQLMAKIRWALIPPKALEDNIDSEITDTMNKIPECLRLLMVAQKYYFSVDNQTLTEKSRSNRCVEAYIVRPERNCLIFCNIRTEEKHSIDNAKVNICGFGSQIVLSNNHLYVNYPNYTSSRCPSKLYSYNIKLKTWEEQTNPYSRREFSFVSHGRKLYCIGGYSYFKTNTPTNLQTCDVYDIPENTWKRIPSLYSGKFQQTCVVKDTVFISGGILENRTDGTPLSTLYTYNTTTQNWAQKSDMNLVRCNHIMSNIGEAIYVIGGRYGMGDGPGHRSDLIDKYSINNDQWTLCTQKFSCFEAASFTNGNRIYIVRNDGIFVFSEDQRSIRKISDVKSYSQNLVMMYLPSM